MTSYVSKTLVYKRVGTPFHEVKLDVYYPLSPPAPLPIVVRLHGGGLLQGSRQSVAPHILNGITKHGYALVSIDYRLAPQVPLTEILQDTLDSLTFVSTELTSQEDLPRVFDTTRIALLGSSAGGYLALLAAVYAKVKPKVVLAIYPITNPLGSFFTRPQPHTLGKVDRTVVAPFLDQNAPVMSDPGPDTDRNKMYYYMLQEANLAELLDVHEGDDQYITAEAIRKHGKEDLPPIYIVHGDADRLVGKDQSDEVVEALKDVDAVYQYDVVQGADHLFDRDASVELNEMYAFMKRYL